MIPGQTSILCITPDHRVLLWGGRDWEKGMAAKEILTRIQYGDYHFGYEAPNTVFILVRQANELQLYTIKLDTDQVQHASIALDTVNSYFSIAYRDGYFKLFNYNHDYQIDPATGTLEKLELPYQRKNIFQGHFSPANQYQHNAASIKSIANSGYSILSNIKRVYLNETGHLCLNDWQITLVNDQLCLQKIEPSLARLKEPRISYGGFKVKANANLVFALKTWEDGSRAFVDKRGFLHLKSSDPGIPEICMVTAINIPLPCWASNGYYTGSHSFIPKVAQNSILPGRQFYEKTLKKFIEKLK